jgi:hypothetical protein
VYLQNKIYMRKKMSAVAAGMFQAAVKGGLAVFGGRPGVLSGLPCLQARLCLPGTAQCSGEAHGCPPLVYPQRATAAGQSAARAAYQAPVAIVPINIPVLSNQASFFQDAGIVPPYMRGAAKKRRFRRSILLYTRRERPALPSDREGRVFARGVHSSVHDLSGKYGLTQDHGKAERSPQALICG